MHIASVWMAACSSSLLLLLLVASDSTQNIGLAEFSSHIIGLYDSWLDSGDGAAFDLFRELAREDHQGRQGVSHAELHLQPLSAECAAWVSYYDHDSNGILSEAEFVPFVRELRIYLVSPSCVMC